MLSIFSSERGVLPLAPLRLPFQEWLKNQVYVFDLVNKVDIDSIFLNSSSSVVIELEFSTLQGTVAANSSFRISATILSDKLLEIQHVLIFSPSPDL